MYRRSLSVMLLVLLFASAKAQLSVSVQEPPAGIVQKKTTMESRAGLFR
ncbi:hypothetical protein ABIE54_003566 [Chitinophagaceae bacterium OAS944]